MGLIRRRFLLTFYVLGLTILTIISVPSIKGTIDIISSNEFSQESLEVFVENFYSTTYRDAVSTVNGWESGYISLRRNISDYYIGSYYTGVPVIDIEIQGRRCFAVLSNSPDIMGQTIILDLSDPSNIVKTGKTVFADNGTALAVDGAFYYTGQEYFGGPDFIVNNATNPSLPFGHMAYGMSGIVTDIESEGRYVYFTVFKQSTGNSLYVYDAEDPSASSFPYKTDWNNGNGLGLTVEGRYAFIAASTDGLYILNITDVRHPSFVGHVDTPGNATDVLVDGRYAYVTDGVEGVQIIDIADPSNPIIIDSVHSYGKTRRLVKQGNTLIVADRDYGVMVIDVADPYHSKVSLYYYYGIKKVNDVAIFGGLIAIASEDDITLFSLSTSKNGITNYNGPNFFNAYSEHQVWDVRVQGNIAYIAGGPDGFYTLDVQYPENPILLDRVDLGGTYTRLDIDGQYAYLVTAENITVFDVTNPENLRYLTHLDIGIGTLDVFVEGHTLYWTCADGANGFYCIMNFTGPGTLSWSDLIWQELIGDNITSIWAQGRHIYTVSNELGATEPAFHISSALDLTDVVVTDTYSEPASFKDIYVDGEVALAVKEGAFVVYDVTHHRNIIRTFEDSSCLDVLGVWGFGPYAIIADTIDGLSLYNATNINSVFPIANRPELTGGTQIVTHGDYTYYANKTSLSVLRHFESAADTYIDEECLGQSLEVDIISGNLIHEATLTAEMWNPPGTTANFQMSADGGTHWEDVTPGLLHVFSNPGEDLRWRVYFDGHTYRSPKIYQITIEYFYNEQPSIPELNDPIFISETSSIEITWNASIDDSNIDHYELQINKDEPSFTAPLDEFTLTNTSLILIGLEDGAYYFRVRAVDDYDLPSNWSSIVEIMVKSSSNLWWIYVIATGGGLIVISILISIYFVRKKKKES